MLNINFSQADKHSLFIIYTFYDPILLTIFTTRGRYRPEIISNYYYCIPIVHSASLLLCCPTLAAQTFPILHS